jgi:hypothetical protein
MPSTAKKPSKSSKSLRQRTRIAATKTWVVMPLVIQAEPVFGKRSDLTIPYAHVVSAFGAYNIRESLKLSVNPKFHWSGKSWVALCKTRKEYDAAYSIITEAAAKLNVGVDDQSGIWCPTTTYIMIDVFQDDDGTAYARLEGSTFERREVIKAHGGKFSCPTKHWEASPTVLGELMPLLLEEGMPVYGTFNWDNAWTEELVKSGYKRTKGPDHITLEEEAEAWEYL